MPWPLNQDYNEAIQHPDYSFADPELREGRPVLNALGLPHPLSGNFADVYEILCPKTGGHWALKCFTRQVPGLRERYDAISQHLRRVRLPFTVPFRYLEQGVRVRGEWYPALKMRWIKGIALNAFVRDNADRPEVLHALVEIWLRVADKLLEAKIGHGDLQHGNVLLVPGKTPTSFSLKLVDYDGMSVPRLKHLPSNETGHPCYQHPQRGRAVCHGPVLDRFPLLVIVTALRCLETCGRRLWTQFDNGDNFLFRAADFADPTRSELFSLLRASTIGETAQLIECLAAACRRPIRETPYIGEAVLSLSKSEVLAALPESKINSVRQPNNPLTQSPHPPVARISSIWNRGESLDQQLLEIAEDDYILQERGYVVNREYKLIHSKWLISLILAVAAGTCSVLLVLTLSRYGGRKGASPEMLQANYKVPTQTQQEAATQSSDSTAISRVDLESRLTAAPTIEQESEIINSLNMTLRLIPAGNFTMGTSRAEQEAVVKRYYNGQRPVWLKYENAHEVKLTQPFYLGKYEVTRGQFRIFVDSTGYKTEAEKRDAGGGGYDATTQTFVSKKEFTWRNSGFPQTDDHPVGNVSWNDATNFCNWLATRENETYRLPTEAEWEYACRGGTTTRFHFGDSDADIWEYANAVDNSLRIRWRYDTIGDPAFRNAITSWLDVAHWDDGYPFTAPVGQFKPNAFGLFDMQGNVWEWCSDRFAQYPTGPTVDPRGPANGTLLRVLRGGSYFHHGGFCRSANRYGVVPSHSYSDGGFRVVMVKTPR